jgi:hypothetical protein
MALTVQCVTIACGDKQAVAAFWQQAVAAFWQQALGWERTYEDDDIIYLEAPGDAAVRQPDLLFLNVADGKVAKNRVHLDLRPDDQAAEVARLEVLGARRIDIGQGEQTWTVMTDVEGNEFCVLRERAPD